MGARGDDGTLYRTERIMILRCEIRGPTAVRSIAGSRTCVSDLLGAGGGGVGGSGRRLAANRKLKIDYGDEIAFASRLLWSWD